jgi:hypothetical protein
MKRSIRAVFLSVFALFIAADVLAQSRAIPPLADVTTRARAAITLFSGSVEAGDPKPFVASFTPEAQAVFTPERFKAIFGQFFEKKISFPEASTAPLHFLSPPAYGTAGSLEAKGFFLQDKAKDNLITFDVSWRIKGATWTMDGFGAKAFPKEGLPTNAQLDALTALVVTFNEALKSGDFGPVHALLGKELQASMTPDQMRKNFERFTRDKVYATSLTKDQVLFEELPDVIGGKYLILKTDVPIAIGTLQVTLMCVREGNAWKTKDLRASVE